MPIEIRELVIRTTVVDQAAEKPSTDSDNDTLSTSGIVAECVEQVMEILREKEER